MKQLALILARKAQAHWQFPTALLLLSGVLAGIGYSQQFSMPPPAGVQVMGCVYNAVQPTITTGNSAYVQCDVNGNIAAGGGGGSLSAKATAAAPTYVEGSTDPLSMDLSGHTRTLDANSAAILAGVTGSIPAGSATIGNINGAPNVTPTDCSGTVTSGGAANNAFTASATKHGFTIANIDTTEVLWFSMTTTAAASTAGSYPLAPATATTFANLSSFTSPIGLGINTALSVIATTTSHKFTCTWW